MKALLCDAQYFYIVEGAVRLSNIQNTLLFVYRNNGYVNSPPGYF
jgi:hypothetical protein